MNTRLYRESRPLGLRIRNIKFVNEKVDLSDKGRGPNPLAFTTGFGKEDGPSSGSRDSARALDFTTKSDKPKPT